MGRRPKYAWTWTGGLALFVAAGLGLLAPRGLQAAPGGVPADPNFTKHIAPILQRSCENCHRPNGVAPMPLVSYEDVRPWARAIKQRTGMGPRGNPADMPPAKVYADERAWAIGTPDLVIKMQELEVKGSAPDWWGEVPSVPTGLTEDSYVAALEIKEVNDVPTTREGNRATVGG